MITTDNTGLRDTHDLRDTYGISAYGHIGVTTVPGDDFATALASPSFAAAQVSAIAGLVYARFPRSTWQEVDAHLKRSTKAPGLFNTVAIAGRMGTIPNVVDFERGYI